MRTNRTQQTFAFCLSVILLAIASGARAAEIFDMTLQAGQHPLVPVIRVLGEVQDNIDQNVQDYSCTLAKQERYNGELGDPQHIFLKVRNEPFSVYMQFLQPYKGREVLYVAGMNDGNLIALDGGWKRKVMSPVSLDPEGMIAMRGQKYPITRVGLHNLVAKIIKRANADLEFAECEVTSDPNQQVIGRSATLIQVTHPVPRKDFYCHIARIFIDNELKVPLHYDSYMWPTEGQSPPLEESYTYGNLKINNSFGARDFAKDNPELFKQ